MANPIVIGVLLLAGAGTLYWVSKKTAPKKKKKLSWLLVGDDCQRLDVRERSDQAAQKFIKREIKVFGGTAPLGDPPGSVELNTEWAHAVATHIFKKLVSPKCISSLDLKGNFPKKSGEPNRFGVDFFPEQYKIPGELQQLFFMLVLGAAGELKDLGYNVVGPPMPIPQPGGPVVEPGGPVMPPLPEMPDFPGAEAGVGPQVDLADVLGDLFS